LLKEPCLGLLLDIPAVIRATSEEKEKIAKYIQIFPSLKIRIHPGDGRLILMDAGGGSNVDSLQDFLSRICVNFSPRCIRKERRRWVHFNVLLVDHNDVKEQTFLKDVTPSGAFIYTTKDWQRGDNGRVLIPAIGEDVSFAFEVRWIRKWGWSLKIPGIGVQFAALPDLLHEELTQAIQSA